jgi:hypothetical protein
MAVGMAYFVSIAVAADLDVAGSSKDTVQTKSSGVSTYLYGTINSKCIEWTDHCVICTRSGCSNIGTACQPKEITCLRAQSADSK